MQPNDVLEIDIERMSFGPAAVGRVKTESDPRPMVVFVEGALPGERVEVKLTKCHKSYWEATLLRVVRPSPDRITPPCPVYERCGGCQWQHMSYPAQLRAKEEILLHQLNRATRIDPTELKAKLTIHGAEHAFGYRARMQVHGDKRGVGFYSARTHEIVHTDRCLVAHADIQNAWSEFLAKRRLAALAQATGQFKIEWTRTESGQIREALNRKHGALGFTQVNPEQNATLVRAVSELAGSAPRKDLVLDLYGGDGNLSANLDFKHRLSIDSYGAGSAPAKMTGPLEPGLHLVRESVEEFLVDQRWLDWGFREIDCVIADPPRNGLREASGRIAGLNASRVVLVSCDPSTLARDLTSFVGPYQLDSIHLIDMFPQTYHLETVVGMSLRR